MMDPPTRNVAVTSDTLTSAMDEITLHPDKQDVMVVNNEVSDATEVNETSDKSFNDKLITIISYLFKDKLLNPAAYARTPPALYGSNEEESEVQRSSKKH